jgi:hypothetical protein
MQRRGRSVVTSVTPKPYGDVTDFVVLLTDFVRRDVERTTPSPSTQNPNRHPAFDSGVGGMSGSASRSRYADHTRERAVVSSVAASPLERGRPHDGTHGIPPPDPHCHCVGNDGCLHRRADPRVVSDVCAARRREILGVNATTRWNERAATLLGQRPPANGQAAASRILTYLSLAQYRAALAAESGKQGSTHPSVSAAVGGASAAVLSGFFGLDVAAIEAQLDADLA